MTTVTIPCTSSAAIIRRESDPEEIVYLGSEGVLVTPSDYAYRRGVYYFPLTDVPAGATIVSAKIQLYMHENVGTNTGTYSAHRVLEYWDQDYVTRAFRDVDNETWSVFGGYYNEEVAAWTPSISYDGPDGWYDWTFGANGRAELQNMINGTYINYGWLVKTSEQYYRMHMFSNHNHATFYPRMEITYTVSLYNQSHIFIF